MPAATKVKMSGSVKKHIQTYNISSIKCLTRKFYVVVMQNNSKEMYKKVCCMGKVVFLLIGPINFFCCSCFCPCLVSHNFIFCLSI